QRFRLTGVVVVGGVEEVHPELERAVHDREAVGFVREPREVGSAEHDGAYLEAGAAETAVFHDQLPVRCAGVNRIGIRRGPEMKFDDSHSGSAASSMSCTRASTSASNASISTRAMCCPRHTWVPPPNAMCGFGVRSMSNDSASGNIAGSRFAAP